MEKFHPTDDGEDEPPIILLAGRMLWDKGIGEFVEASRLVNNGEQKARFVLAGKPDSNNPKSISEKQLHVWNESGVVEWWGFCNNMVEIIQKSCIVALPSYYEGVPKILIEAAACGRPVIATDMPGCREIVHEGYNGCLTKAKSSNDLAEKILQLLSDKEQRIKMGENGRKLACNHFSAKETIERTFRLYEDLLKR
jgi:glycosyltransferase involved in cell wall biosynthesis